MGVAGAAIVVFLAAVAPWAFGSFRTFPSETERAHYQEVCEPIIAWIEEQRSVTGRYPKALADTHLAAIKGLDPMHSYRTFEHKGVQSFELAIGDYNRYHWVYYYSSRHGKWYSDR